MGLKESFAAHLRGQPFTTEMVAVLSKSSWVFTFVYGVACKSDDGDEHNQANNDAEDGCNGSDLVRKSCDARTCQRPGCYRGCRLGETILVVGASTLGIVDSGLL